MAKRAPAQFLRVMEEVLKVTEHWRELVTHAIEMRHTVDVGINRTFSSNRDAPFPTKSLIEPMPSALMDDPPTPVTVLSTIGCNVRKSDRSGEIWVVHVLSRRNGDDSKERFVRREEADSRAAMMAARSSSSIFLLLSRQSTNAWRYLEWRAKRIQQGAHILQYRHRIENQR